MELSKLVVKGKNNLVREVVYDEDAGVSFKLKYAPKKELKRLTGIYTTTETNKKTHQVEEKLDSAALSKEIARKYVIGWSGVTLNWLKNLVVIEGINEMPKEDLDKEIAFTTDNLETIIENAYDVDNWIFENIKEAANFNEACKEEELKN